MEARTRQRLLAEAVRIGDAILARAERDDDGATWRTMAVDLARPREVFWAAREDLYSGASGIALFLAELSRHARARRFADAAARALEWSVRRCARGALPRCDLYTGRMGVAWALLRLAEVTGDRAPLGRAVELARSCSDGPLAEPAGDDLVNGAAGALLGALRLHAATGEPFLRARALALAELLVERALPARRGLTWDHSAEQVRGPCGLAHGASGVGVALLAASALPGGGPLARVADLAFAYENDWFDPRTSSWPDFRKVLPTEAELDAEAPDLAAFEGGGDTNAWCHGAVGIGLGRLHAWRARGGAEDARDVRRALRRTLDGAPPAEPSARSFTLCHGRGAAIELLAEAGRLLDESRARAAADALLGAALDARERGESVSGYRFAGAEPDLSLFLGDAGVGHAFLRALDPDGTPSVLVPAIVTMPAAADERADAALRRRLAAKVLPRTLRVLEAVEPAALEACFSGGDDGPCPWSGVDGLVERLVADGVEAGGAVADVHALERRRFEMDCAVGSWAGLAVRELLDQRAARGLERLDDAALSARTLGLAERSRPWTARWRWADRERPSAYLATPPGEHPMLLTTYARRRTVEVPLDPLPWETLSRFARPRRVADVAREVAAIVAEEDRTELAARVLTQVRQALRAGVLVEPEVGPVPTVRPRVRGGELRGGP